MLTLIQSTFNTRKMFTMGMLLLSIRKVQNIRLGLGNTYSIGGRAKLQFGDSQ